MKVEQFICMIFVPIGLLLGGINSYERNFLFGIDNYLIKLNRKHNVNIDRTTYCKFQGIETIKTATSLLILDVILFLGEVKDLKTIIIIISIWGVVGTFLCHSKKKKFINMQRVVGQ